MNNERANNVPWVLQASLMHDHDRKECVKTQHGTLRGMRTEKIVVPWSSGVMALRHPFPFPLPARPSRALSFPEPPDFGHAAIGGQHEAINCSLRLDFCRRSLSSLSRTLLRAAALAVETGNS